MFASMMESARNSTFRNPFVSTVNCESGESQNLVAGRKIAAAAASAEGGKN